MLPNCQGAWRKRLPLLRWSFIYNHATQQLKMNRWVYFGSALIESYPVTLQSRQTLQGFNQYWYSIDHDNSGRDIKMTMASVFSIKVSVCKELSRLSRLVNCLHLLFFFYALCMAVATVRHSLCPFLPPLFYSVLSSSFKTADLVAIFFICVSSSFSPPARRISRSSIARIFFCRLRSFFWAGF